MNKKELSERDICTKFITPALRRAGWDEQGQLREEVTFTKGRVIVRGRMVSRGKAKRADYILYFKPNIPLAVIEAKDNHSSVGDGIQQALEYAETLKLPFVFSSNGDGFVFHDRTVTSGVIEKNLSLDEFPSPATLWARYRGWQGLPPEADEIVLQDYYSAGSGKGPRYYQATAVNAATEAIAKGQQRLLLVMATGTGKTYTAFQIIWRLWKAGRKKRILFLADRNVLVDQTMVNDFRPFGAAMAKLSTGSKVIEREDGTVVDLPLAIDRKRRIDTSYEIYLALYQAITGPEDRQKIFRELRFSFPLPPLGEQHRIVAKVDELMALCDRLEAAQAERERRRDVAASALSQRPVAVGAVTESSTEPPFGVNRLPRLVRRPEQVAHLRRTVIDLAVRGGLSPAADWPPTRVPLRKFATLQNGYAFKSEWFVPQGVRLLRNVNVGHGTIKWHDSVCITEARANEFGRFALSVGDIVLSLDRPFIASGTKLARVLPSDMPSLLLQRVGRFQIHDQHLTSEYLLLWLHSSDFTDQIDPGRSNGVPHVSSKQVEDANIWVPRPAAQRYVVEKVEALLALCDRLEAELTTAQTQSARLLEAVLHRALEDASTGASIPRSAEPMTAS